MSPYYDLILNCNGIMSIQLIKAIDASDAWTLGINYFPDSLRGEICRKQHTNQTNASGHES